VYHCRSLSCFPGTACGNSRQFAAIRGSSRQFAAVPALDVTSETTYYFEIAAEYAISTLTFGGGEI